MPITINPTLAEKTQAFLQRIDQRLAARREEEERAAAQRTEELTQAYLRRTDRVALRP